MRIILQRVKRAAVAVSGELREIGPGLVVLLGVGPEDDEIVAGKMAEKTAYLRVFANDAGKFDKSILDVTGSALVVSQFTLYGDCRKGRRPDFTGAMPPEKAEPVYRAYISALEGMGVHVRTGDFGAQMEVELINDGPVTLWLDSSS